MYYDDQGWAHQDYGWESVFCAMANSMRLARLKQIPEGDVNGIETKNKSHLAQAPQGPASPLSIPQGLPPHS